MYDGCRIYQESYYLTCIFLPIEYSDSTSIHLCIVFLGSSKKPSDDRQQSASFFLFFNQIFGMQMKTDIQLAVCKDIDFHQK
jgi:hypothetical protein